MRRRNFIVLFFAGTATRVGTAGGDFLGCTGTTCTVTRGTTLLATAAQFCGTGSVATLVTLASAVSAAFITDGSTIITVMCSMDGILSVNTTSSPGIPFSASGVTQICCELGLPACTALTG